jgi:hypothetical protein
MYRSDVPQLYLKIGSRYKPVKEFQGFPADGVWLVYDGSQSCMIRLSDFPSVPKFALDYLALSDEITRLLREKWSSEPLSTKDIVMFVLNEVARRVEEC